jgi:SAM-dependent methyltransferase
MQTKQVIAGRPCPRAGGLPNVAGSGTMNWRWLRPWPWVDTRAAFVAATPRGGTLLDLGSSDGETLRHMAELRPDLHFHAVDKAGTPDAYPAGCEFVRADLERDPLPWPDASFDAITCMHLVEHLRSLDLLMNEVARLLKPGGRVYFETPHPKTLQLPSIRSLPRPVRFTLNFYDDPTHVRVVPTIELAGELERRGLVVLGSGISRNWLFALSHWILRWGPPGRKQLTARVHWLGWSAWVAARRPAAAEPSAPAQPGPPDRRPPPP